MKILSDKKYLELKSNKIINEYCVDIIRSNKLSLSFERAIAQILKQNNLKEIEIPQSYIMNNETLSVCENPAKNTLIIKVESQE